MRQWSLWIFLIASDWNIQVTAASITGSYPPAVGYSSKRDEQLRRHEKADAKEYNNVDTTEALNPGIEVSLHSTLHPHNVQQPCREHAGSTALLPLRDEGMEEGDGERRQRSARTLDDATVNITTSSLLIPSESEEDHSSRDVSFVEAEKQARGDRQRNLCPTCRRRRRKTKVSFDMQLRGNNQTVPPVVPSFCPVEPFERYVELHNNITHGVAERRYLVYRPYLVCGMGNRLSGFQGVLALAVMTNRALLVDWWGGVSGKSTSYDKYEDNFLEPHGVPHSTIPPSMKNYANLSGTEIWCQMSNAVRVSTECSEDRFTPDFLATASWDEVYAADVPVVVIQAHNHNPLDFLRQNTRADVVGALGALDAEFGPDIFRLCAMRFLFRPRPKFQRDYCRQRSRVLNGKFPSVALHVRTGDNPAYHPEWRESLPKDLDNFLECARGLEEGLTLVAANSSDPLGLPGLGSSVETVWPLGTDSDEVLDLLKERNATVNLGGKIVYIEGGKSHRVHSGSKGGAANNMGPIMDMAMLSESVLLVGSYHSSFSLHVAEVGGLPLPLRINVLTPFAKIFGHKSDDGMAPAVHLKNFRQECRDFVADPSLREYLRAAIRASREPFIDCEADYGG